MDIKIIISMFEDLKKLISEQFSNLSKLVESPGIMQIRSTCATDYTTTSGSVRVREPCVSYKRAYPRGFQKAPRAIG